MNNPMSSDDYEAIEWLEEESQKIPALANAWQILRKYYEECKEELRHIDEVEDLVMDDNERDKLYREAREKFSNEKFVQEAEKFLGVSRDEIKSILDYPDDDLKHKWVIVKFVRLYNMHLKLGHSARITYLAEQSLEKLPEGENTEVLQRTVLLSALLHDVGRFYQAAHYNDLSDDKMKGKEKHIGDLEVDHAVAGYYYSLASSLELHKLGIDGGEDEILRFVSESVAAVVVKCHQKNNSDIHYFDYSGSSSALDDLDMVGDAYVFVNESYDQARLMSLDVAHQMNPKHKEFIDHFVAKIKDIISSRRIDYSAAAGFEIDEENMNREFQELDDEIHAVLNHMQGLSGDEISGQIVEIMNRKMKKISNVELDDSEKEQYRADILETLKGMLDYDIAMSIEERFKAGDNAPSSVRYLLSSAMYLTMDADKIDILNQRALGIYNTSYRVGVLETFPTKDSNLIDILNNRFHFDLNSEPLVLNAGVMDVMNRMSKEVKEMIQKKLGDLNVFDSKKFPKDTEIAIYRDKVVINGVEYPGNEYYNIFHDEWISYVARNIDSKQIDPSLDLMSIKREHYDLLTIGISRNSLDENLKNCTQEERVDAIRKLLISDGMKQRFMLEANNTMKAGWVLDSENSDEMIHGAISGLIWQLNQFILCNMRNKSSFEFIEQYDILDQIYEQYLEKDPEVAAILKEYIDYCKKFIQHCLTELHEDTFTGDDMERMRQEVYSGSGETMGITY